MKIIKTLAIAALLSAAVTGGAMAQAETDFASVTAETPIVLMRVSELAAAGAVDPADLDAAAAENPEGLAAFHASVEASPVVVAYLEGQGFASVDVVGVSTGEDGALTILVDDR